MMARLTKMIGQQVKQLGRLTRRLNASSLPLPSACGDAINQAQNISSSASPNALGIRQTLSDCQQESEQMLYVPNMMASIKSSLAQLAKKGVDVTAMQSQYVSLATALGKLKSGVASDDDIQAFFDTADDLRGQVEDALLQAGMNVPEIFQIFDLGSHTIQPVPATPSNSGSLMSNVYGAFVQFFKFL